LRSHPLTPGSPLAKEPALIKIAEKHNVSPATALISYGVSRGIVVLPKSVTPARIESNLKTIQLDQEDLDALNKLADEGGKQQRITSPPWGSDFVSYTLRTSS
jgi:glycerol 2-dehydrogenase (NADP+)